MSNLESLRREAAAKLALCIHEIQTRQSAAIPLDQVLPSIDAIARVTVAQILHHIDPKTYQGLLDQYAGDPTHLLPPMPPNP